MSKEQAFKVAEAFVLKHKPEFKKGRKGVTRKEINIAVQKVAKALRGLQTNRVQQVRCKVPMRHIEKHHGISKETIAKIVEEAKRREG